MTPSSVAPGVQSSAPQDFANPASVPTVEPGFEAELSLALLGQPAPTEAATEEDGGPENPIVLADVGLQNLPPVLTWLPTLAANFSTPADAGAHISQTLRGVGLQGAVAITETVTSALDVAATEPAALAMSPPQSAGSASMAFQQVPLESAPAFNTAPLVGSAAEDASAAAAAAQLQEAQGGAGAPAPLATASTPHQTQALGVPSNPQPTQVPAAPSNPQPTQAWTETAPPASAVDAPPAVQPQPTTGAKGVTSAAVAAAAQAVQLKAQPERSPHAAAAPGHTEASEPVHTAPRIDLGPELPPAQAGLPSAPTTAPDSSAAVDAQAAESAPASKTNTSPAAAADLASHPATAAAEPSPAAEPVSHGGPRLGIEEGPETETVLAKAAADSKAPVSASTAPMVETASAVDSPNSPSSAGGSVPAPSASGLSPTPVSSTTPATVDVSLPIKPHMVSLEGGAVQVEILRMARDGGGQITLELTPPDQGRYRLDLRIDDLGQATLLVDGASESTRTRLEMGESALREQFSHLGLQLNLQLRSSQGEHRQEADLSHASSSSQESDAQPTAGLAATSRRSTALDLDRGLVRLYA